MQDASWRCCASRHLLTLVMACSARTDWTWRGLLSHFQRVQVAKDPPACWAACGLGHEHPEGGAQLLCVLLCASFLHMARRYERARAAAAASTSPEGHVPSRYLKREMRPLLRVTDPPACLATCATSMGTQRESDVLLGNPSCLPIVVEQACQTSWRSRHPEQWGPSLALGTLMQNVPVRWRLQQPLLAYQALLCAGSFAQRVHASQLCHEKTLRSAPFLSDASARLCIHSSGPCDVRMQCAPASSGHGVLLRLAQLLRGHCAAQGSTRYASKAAPTMTYPARLRARKENPSAQCSSGMPVHIFAGQHAS